jgi:F-type H+-transporting ATPase subunit delta
MDAVANKYVKALTQGADSGVKQEYYQILDGFAQAYEQKEIAQALNSPLVPSEKKVGLMQEFADRTDKHMGNFLKLIAQNNRFSVLPAMADKLRLQLQSESNSYEGRLKAGHQMSEGEISALESALAKKTGTNITIKQVSQDYDGVQVTIADLGIEVGYSKQRTKDKLIDYIVKSF